MEEKPNQTKVYVGLSGGVDSSVAAALLKEQGYDVTGVFIRIWNPQWGECNWKYDRRDAMRVALQLGIPFETIDLSCEYEEGVARYMIDEYRSGRTPNPDVMCNSVVKFGAFFNWARKQGADFVATGHYARKRELRITNDELRIKTQNPKSQVQLLQGVDQSKDQSYFLWQLTQEQLQHVLFPVGEYKKSEVRALAKKFGLPTAEKKDSQGLCFVGKIAMKDFLKKYIKPKRGDVLNEQDEVIGWHEGAAFYTLGQRHGFTITTKGTDDVPMYIIDKDITSNTLTVGSAQEQLALNKKKGREVTIKQVHWIAHEPSPDKEYMARFRHLQQLQRCHIVKAKRKNEYRVVFVANHEVAVAGQSLVVYDDNSVCLGGGLLAE